SKQYALQSPIRANGDTRLLAEEREEPVEYSGESDHACEGTHVFGRRPTDNSQRFRDANDICNQSVRTQHSDGKEYEMLERLLRAFAVRPWSLSQTPLLSDVAVDEIFDCSEDYFHDQRLGAHSSAAIESVHHDEEDDEHEERDHCNCQQDK